MIDKQWHPMCQFLGGHWYDRPEDDDAIVAEISCDYSDEELRECIALLQAFLNHSISEREKERFIRETIWRAVPPAPRGAIHWLEQIVHRLEATVTTGST